MTGAAGPQGPRGPQGSKGDKGDKGDRGENGRAPSCVYAGLFNTGCGHFEVTPDDVVAMTFSHYMPAQGAWYDDHHSIVVNEPGVYELHFCLRAASADCGQLQMAITNDGVILPCTALTAAFGSHGHIDLSGMAIAEVKAGAHLHFIVYGKETTMLTLDEGVNLMLCLKKICEMNDCGCG